jgi:Pyruvate/2-oxoacid:ferredoxin oxidoreductase delta subunit
MRSQAPFPRHTETLHICLDTRVCQACWDCIAVCPQHVLAKVDLFFHKHALVRHADQCKGCLRCVKVCPNGAINKKAKIHDNGSQTGNFDHTQAE